MNRIKKYVESLLLNVTIEDETQIIIHGLYVDLSIRHSRGTDNYELEVATKGVPIGMYIADQEKAMTFISMFASSDKVVAYMMSIPTSNGDLETMNKITDGYLPGKVQDLEKAMEKLTKATENKERLERLFEAMEKES